MPRYKLTFRIIYTEHRDALNEEEAIKFAKTMAHEVFHGFPDFTYIELASVELDEKQWP